MRWFCSVDAFLADAAAREQARRLRLQPVIEAKFRKELQKLLTGLDIEAAFCIHDVVPDWDYSDAVLRDRAYASAKVDYKGHVFSLRREFDYGPAFKLDSYPYSITGAQHFCEQLNFLVETKKRNKV